ncbi:DNA polymerase I [candidate division WWE3 bacterium]|uniref:DNA-directed DNA polymerase n=1 Tax=candidate division WWE3 bacterium TaxID=2053526 RepID=A0A955LK10_UNCKA|nr:DNA polymerase I [candidate division WWE3 bacterium]
MKSKSLVLVDANSLLHRAYHAMPSLTSPQGGSVGAVYGFTSMLLSVMHDLNPSYIVVVWDTASPTFRHNEYSEYKQNRPEIDEELSVQFQPAKEVVEGFNVPQYSMEGYEADDIIGTLVRQFAGHEEVEQVIIVTGDSDIMQLVDEKTRVYSPRKSFSDTVLYDREAVEVKYSGLSPAQIVDYKALCGDSSDNIPGVSGVGDKTATALLTEYGSLEGVYEHLDEIKARTQKLLRQGRESAFLSKKLATIYKNVPVKLVLTDAVMSDYDQVQAISVLQKYGFKSLLGRLPKGEGNGESLVPSVKLQQNINNDTDIKGLELASNVDWQLLNGFDMPSGGLLIAFGLLSGSSGKEVSFERMFEWLFEVEVSDFNSLGDDKKDELLFVAWQQIKSLLDQGENGMIKRLFYETELPLREVLQDMHDVGIMVDREVLSKLKTQYLNLVSQKESDIFECVGHEFNLNSPKQLEQVLFDNLGLPVIKKTKTQRSTDESVLQRLAGLHPVVAMILDYRKIYKILSTYLEPLLGYLDDQDRVHTTFVQTNAASGRLSSESPNLQNIPVDEETGLRRVFIAPKGKRLVVADYSQIELRIMAHITEDERLISSFEHGQDIHTATAARIFNKLVDDVTSEERRVGKTVNFSIMYGISAHGLSENLGVEHFQAEGYINNYYENYPGVKKWKERYIEQSRRLGYVETLYGRRRYLPDLNASNYQRRSAAERIAINHPLQGTQADILKSVMVRFVEKYKDDLALWGAHMLLQVHDELVFEVLEDRVGELSRIVRDEMENAVELSVPLKVDVKSGDNWQDTHEVEF